MKKYWLISIVILMILVGSLLYPSWLNEAGAQGTVGAETNPLDSGDSSNQGNPAPVEEYKFKLNIDQKKVQVSLDGSPLESLAGKMASGAHTLEIRSPGFKDKQLDLFITKDTTLNLKMDPPASLLIHQRTVGVGSLPKGMDFSLDGRYLFIALLGEPAVVMLDGMSLDFLKRIEPADKKYAKGEFVEIGVPPQGGAILASQMTTASVHRIPLEGDKALEISDSISTRGIWSKVIAFSKKGQYFAVSNWSSLDVTLFTYPEMEFIKKVKIPGIPRGMVFAEEDKSLYVSNYSTGALHKVDLEQGKVVETIKSPWTGALRHLAIDEERGLLYASEMYRGYVFIYNLHERKIIKQIKVDSNPNTIALTPDRKYLFVSCRGPNAKTSYLDRSPRSGRLYMIDCSTQEIADMRILGNQPTALAVHPSGKYVAVSNFRDKNIEVYGIDQYLNEDEKPEERAESNTEGN